MTTGPVFAGVDLGNSAAKVCVVDADGQLQQQSIRYSSVSGPASAWTRKAFQWVDQYSGGNAVRWRIASVHGSATSELIQAIGSGRDNDSVFVIRHSDIPMPALVDQPERLGIDRLLGAWGAMKFATPPFAVVDAGSAVTVDWVNQRGQFAGGAILPGIKLQTAALGSGTDALPKIQWEAAQRFSVPATNTADAIRLGILVGLSGAIDRLVEEYAKENLGLDPNSPYKTSPTIVLTGGNAEAVAPHIRGPYKHVRNLVCQATLGLDDSAH